MERNSYAKYMEAKRWPVRAPANRSLEHSGRMKLRMWQPAWSFPIMLRALPRVWAMMWNHALLALFPSFWNSLTPSSPEQALASLTQQLTSHPHPWIFSSDTNTFNRNTLTTSNVTCNFFPSELTTSTKPLTLFYAFLDTFINADFPVGWFLLLHQWW